MTLRSERELVNTQRKLRLLEEAYQETHDDLEEDEHVRVVTMESLKRLINQFKEEIARYKAHQPMRPDVQR